MYPGGSVPYLYGASILRYIEDRYGPEKVREISHRYANECIAGGINRVATQAVGRPYTERVRRRTSGTTGGRSASHRYALQNEEAERRGLTTARRLTYDAPAPRGTGPRPVFFRDGTLVYQRDNNDQRARVRPAEPRHRQRASRWRPRTAAGRRRRPPTGAGWSSSASTSFRCGWRIAGSAHTELDRPLPRRSRRAARSGR